MKIMGSFQERGCRHEVNKFVRQILCYDTRASAVSVALPTKPFYPMPTPTLLEQNPL